ncbi:hypothetical protein BCR33DRAFT_194013 [Rhizoclosmatium globosum]|uniref:BTB domain-containing protein n=1 Tax=Rhizoclosmatium globosum TaxID=329046 RepID=A0A1Y2CDK6_9FUNG|nr:hypothetical protein BCR33DRAFT_194013 [Rhizoclosmatium globosum]|eukprot:ORY45141.1 hypothetical protein BCR33DRAFT_194013 [Rhizoclosmatium globosum]
MRHPDASIETMSLILDYFYSGSVTVPNTNIVQVSLFADQLLLTALKEKCDVHLLGDVSPSKTHSVYFCIATSSDSAISNEER